MITDDLYSVFGQLLVGVYALGTILIFIWLVVGRQDQRLMVWFAETLRSILGTQSAPTRDWKAETIFYPLMLSAIFGLGIVVQSAVDDLVDTEPSTPISLRWIAGLLDGENAHRFSTIYRPVKIDYPWQRIGACKADADYELTSLGAEILSDRRVISHFVDFSKARQVDFLADPARFLTAPTKADCEIAEVMARKVYYDSNHWAVSNNALSNVLLRWQSQIDFLSCLHVLSMIVTIGLFLYAVGNWILYRMRKEARASDQHFRSARAMCLWALLLGTGSAYGYSLAQKNYIERAIGFYASAHHYTDIKHPGLSDTPETGVALADPKIGATRWMADSGEYRAAALQAYRLAEHVIQERTRQAGKRPAVILDLDETVLSNVPFEMVLRQTRTQMKPERFDAWQRHAAACGKCEAVQLVPGAMEFIQFLLAEGITPVFITNRSPSIRAETLTIMAELGLTKAIGFEPIVYFGEGSKQSRREAVAARYTVLALVGDDLNDFSDYYDTYGKTPAGKVPDKAFADVASRWFIIPNPIYGSWLRALEKQEVQPPPK